MNHLISKLQVLETHISFQYSTRDVEPLGWAGLWWGACRDVPFMKMRRRERASGSVMKSSQLIWPNNIEILSLIKQERFGIWFSGYNLCFNSAVASSKTPTRSRTCFSTTMQADTRVYVVLWPRTDARQDAHPCVWKRKAPCRTHFVRSMHLAFVALIQLFLYHISWDGKHIGSFLGPMFIQSRDPNIVQTKIPSDPLLTTRFAPTNHWLVWQDENIFAAHKTVTYLFITLGLLSVTSSPCCHLFFPLCPHCPSPALCCTEAKHRPSLLSLLENAKSYQTVGSLTGTTPRGLIKAKVKSHSALSYTSYHYPLAEFSYIMAWLLHSNSLETPRPLHWTV